MCSRSLKQLKNERFCKLTRIDVFQDDASIPGLVLEYVRKGTDSGFYLFDEGDK